MSDKSKQVSALDDFELEDMAHSALQEGLSFGVNLDVFMRFAKRIASAALSQRPAPAAVPDDLRARCAEILNWRKSGVLTGDALSTFAGTQWYAKEHNSLQMAETDTAREAYELIAATPAAPAPRNNHGVDAHYFHRKLSLVLRDFESLTPDELARTLARLAKVADEKVLAEREFAPAPAAQEPITEDAAYQIGATGAEPTECERLLFEAWMRGHCWKVCGQWDGNTYVSASEDGMHVDHSAMLTRQLWAAWRDRAALSAKKPAAPSSQPNSATP